MAGSNTGNKVGQPTKYNEAMQKIADDYLAQCRNANPPQIPFMEELALLCDVDDDTINEWTKVFPVFSATIKKIKGLQRLRLQQRSLGRVNPVGAIFLLKANHGMKETIVQEVDNSRGIRMLQEIIEAKRLKAGEEYDDGKLIGAVSD
jgi:hypothetical protein